MMIDATELSVTLTVQINKPLNEWLSGLSAKAEAEDRHIAEVLKENIGLKDADARSE